MKTRKPVKHSARSRAWSAVSMAVSMILLSITIHQFYMKDENRVKKERKETFYIDPPLTNYVLNYYSYLDKNGIEVPKVPLTNIHFNYHLPDRILGVAFGMFQDDAVIVAINGRAWPHLTVQEKLALVFHELSHDVYDIEHGDIKGLMDPGLPRYISDEDLIIWMDDVVKFVKENR